MKTERQLKDEWGQERFVEALCALSSWYIEKGVPQSVEQIEALMKSNQDAFDVFVARMLERGTTKRAPRASLGG